MDSNWENLVIYTNEKNKIMEAEYEKDKCKEKDVEYIIVLAGGLQADGKVHPFVKERLDKAVNLYIQISQERQCKILALGGGTYHKPPILNADKYVIHESTSCAQYLHSQGIPQNDIYREWSSYDTIANAFYCFLNYILPLNIKKCSVITSEFHMERTKSIFQYFNSLSGKCCSINFLETSNHTIGPEILSERKKREEQSCLHFREKIIPYLTTWEKFTIWFYTEHDAYKSIIEYKNNDKINKTY